MVEQSTLTFDIISFVRKLQMHGTVELKYCRTEDMVADMLTKGLSNVNFERLRNMAGVTPIPIHFAQK